MTPPRLLEIFGHLVDQDPGAPILLDAQRDGAPARQMTRVQLRDLGNDMATDLAALRIEPGDCVAVWLPNWSYYVGAHLAALARGAHVVGINTRYNVEEVAHVLRTARPRAVVIAHDFLDLDLAGRLRTAHRMAAAPAPVVLVVTAPGAAPATDVSDYDLGAGAMTFPRRSGGDTLRPAAPTGLAAAFTTSGSSGVPKLAAHSEVGVSGHMLAVGRRIGLRRGHVMLGALPLSGVFGYTACMAAVLAGAAVLLEPVFEGHRVLADMVRHHVTHIIGADDLIGRIEYVWHSSQPDLPLTWIGIADFEGHSKRLAAWAHSAFGTTVAGVYGSSELFALTTVWPDSAPPESRYTGGGELVDPAVELRVADPGTGAAVDIGQDGEMQFRGPNVVDAYLGEPDRLSENLTADGWFRSGDLGRLLSATSVQYLCRIGDVLRLHGFLVDPAEIEDRLLAHPAVRRAKVVGVEAPNGGTRAVAFVEPEGTAPAHEDELRSWCADTLAKFKIPDDVYVVAQLPTTSGTNGVKIRTAALREIAQRHVTTRGRR